MYYIVNKHIIFHKQQMDFQKPNDLTQQCLNPTMMGAKKSATLNINEKSIQLQKDGKKVYRYGLGQSPFPVPKIMVNELQNHAREKDYLAVSGLKQLRENIAKWVNRLEGTIFDENDILVSPGSKQLLFSSGLALDSCLIVESPCWVSYIPQVKILGKQIKNVQTKYQNRWRLTAEELENVCKEPIKAKTRVLILTYPDNPTGLTYCEKELKELAEVAKKYKIIIISDEIYGQTTYDCNHCSIARFYPEGTIISNGLSKWAGAGGWRLGFFAFPKQLTWMKNAMTSIASQSYTSVCAPIQYSACSAFLQSAQIDEYVKQECEILKVLSTEIYSRLTCSTKIKTYQPQGGFYFFLDFFEYRQKLAEKQINLSAELTERILEETGCATLPGENFGRPSEQLTLRLAFVNFDGEAALNALSNAQCCNLEFLQKYCKQTLQGINALINWTESL